MPTHRFNYESDPTLGGTWFDHRGRRICDWSWDGEKKILTVWPAPSRKPVSLSCVDVERLEPQELGKRLSQAALEAAQRVHRGRSAYEELWAATVCTAWTHGLNHPHHALVRVLTHVKKLGDAFGLFLVRVICDCGACREIEPEALARLVGWSVDPQGTRSADEVLEVREEGGGGRNGCEAKAARCAKESTLTPARSASPQIEELIRIARGITIELRLALSARVPMGRSLARLTRVRHRERQIQKVYRACDEQVAFERSSVR